MIDFRSFATEEPKVPAPGPHRPRNTGSTPTKTRHLSPAWWPGGSWTLTTFLSAPLASKAAVRWDPGGVLLTGLVLTGAATAGLIRLGTASGYGWFATRLALLGIGLALALLGKPAGGPSAVTPTGITRRARRK